MVVELDIIVWLPESEPIAIPRLTAAEIEDKRKADDLAKILIVLQGGRRAHRIP